MSRTALRRLGVDTGYAVLALPVAVAGFAVVVAGLAAGTGLLVVWVGVAVLAATLLAARGFAGIERAWLPAVLGTPLPRPAYRRAEGRAVRRLTTPLRDPQCWLDALHTVLRFPFALLAFVLTVTWWGVTLGGLTYGLWDWALPYGPENQDLLQLLGLPTGTGRRILAYTLIGAVFAVLLPLVVRGVALLQATLGRVLLTSRAATQAELGRLAEGRDAAVAAEAVANVAKHSGATTCRVAVVVAGPVLRVTVEDDGRGGAVAAPGHGLAGLADRLRAVDGVLTVDSPPGGPTRLVAELPCGW